MQKIILFIVLIMFAGCSNKPSNSDIREQLVKLLQQKSADKIFKVKNIERINGFEQSHNIYIAHVRFDLTFRADSKELGRYIMNSFYVNNVATFIIINGYSNSFQKGDKIHQEKKIKLMKTDNGWMIDTASSNVFEF